MSNKQTNNSIRTIDIRAKKIGVGKKAFYKYWYYSEKTDQYFEVHFRQEAGDIPEQSFKAEINVSDMNFKTGVKASYYDRDDNRVTIEKNTLWISKFNVVGEVEFISEDCDLYI